MSSKTGVEIGDFPHQVSDKLELGNRGASLSELFGYSKEFEHQLYLEMQPDDFKITSLLYESENVDDFLKLMEHKNQNVNMFQHNLISSQQSYVTVQELAPTVTKIHEHNISLSHQEQEVDKQETNHLLPPPAIQTSHDKSHFQWSSELHSGVMGAIEQLGGFERPTPESILCVMNVKGLTLDHVKSHLQVPKYENDHLRPPPFAIEATDRIQWSPELHERFSGAIDLLGGPERATPSQIFHLMNVTKGLTLQHVKSHLQTYRKILDEITKAAFGTEEATRSASVFVDQGGPSKPRTAKRSKRKGKACIGTLAKKVREILNK
ncbi:myb family transcription factor PHL7-like isoform X2 [Euphorbia lathyris]|uniref:myb family transcription factor PHL7-like isoform X2 n=1 Tax=Euphorbia lathyris TaxID=212925 RepID=UPI003313A9D2